MRKHGGVGEGGEGLEPSWGICRAAFTVHARMVVGESQTIIKRLIGWDRMVKVEFRVLEIGCNVGVGKEAEGEVREAGMGKRVKIERKGFWG